MTTDRYFLAVPGSDDPPKGPYTPDEIAREVSAGSVPNTSLVCKVGEAMWAPVTTLAKSQPRATPATPPNAAPAPPAGAAERYKNLVSVSGSLSVLGGVVQILALVFLGGALLGAVVAYQNSPMLALVLAVGSALAIPLYAAGIVVAACGEALLALRDIAVNTLPTSGLST